MPGARYTIVGMAVWGWARVLSRVLEGDPWERLPNLRRLFDEVDARPAARRARALATRHVVRQEVDQEARRFLFPHSSRLAAG